MSILDQLKEPFGSTDVKWRQGRGNTTLAYIDARAVMKRLDDVVGIANWQDKYKSIDGRTICELSLRIDGEWITKSDGAGDTNIEGEKGGISDSFKRAAVKFGIGRYLYYVPQGVNNYWSMPDCLKAPKDRMDLSKTVAAMRVAMDATDPSSLVEAWDELSHAEKQQAFKYFTETEQTTIKDLLKVARGE